MYGIFPYAGLKFYFYEEMKRHVPAEHKKDISLKLVCGSVAGLLGQTLTYPLDVVRRQMQVERLYAAAKEETVRRGTMQTLVKIAREEGWKQLFSGLSINYLKVCLIIVSSILSLFQDNLMISVGSFSVGCTISGNRIHCI